MVSRTVKSAYMSIKNTWPWKFSTKAIYIVPSAHFVKLLDGEKKDYKMKEVNK